MGQHPLHKKEEMLHQAPIRHPFGFRAFMDHVAASCLAGSIISRQNSCSAELFPCSSQLQVITACVKQTVGDTSPRTCATTILQRSTQCGDNRHYYSGGMEMSAELDAVQIYG